MTTHKQNEIKVFKPHSKRADFTIRAITPEGATKKLGELIPGEAEQKAQAAFRSLKSLGGEHLTLKTAGRRIKVQLADAA